MHRITLAAALTALATPVAAQGMCASLAFVEAYLREEEGLTLHWQGQTEHDGLAYAVWTAPDGRWRIVMMKPGAEARLLAAAMPGRCHLWDPREAAA